MHLVKRYQCHDLLNWIAMVMKEEENDWFHELPRRKLQHVPEVGFGIPTQSSYFHYYTHLVSDFIYFPAIITSYDQQKYGKNNRAILFGF